jgi:ssDNA-binding Zn-finger/Zn-ribbon topoisomerase 1
VRHGAQFDKSTGDFYVVGDVPEPLEAFGVEPVERTFLPVQRPPKCPTCQAPMARRASKKTGEFWGCSNYPTCKATQPYAMRRLDVTELVFNDPSMLFRFAVASERATAADYFRIARKALQVYGEETFEEWLFGPNLGMGNLYPADLLGTKRGIAYVEQLLVEVEKRSEV